jgi:hypothetical protein
MTFRYKIFKDLKFIYAKAEGTLTADDLDNHLDQLVKDPDYIPPMLKLVDQRNVKAYGLTNKQAEQFAMKKASLDNRFRNEKCAILVASDLGFGVARIHQAFLDESAIQIEVFRSLGNAKKWLDVNISDEDLV